MRSSSGAGRPAETAQESVDLHVDDVGVCDGPHVAEAFTQSAIEAALRHGSKRAGLRRIGAHVLRHTFCSHLAMRGAATKGDSGARRTLDAEHDASVHALGVERAQGRDCTPELWAAGGQRRKDHVRNPVV